MLNYRDHGGMVPSQPSRSRRLLISLLSAVFSLCSILSSWADLQFDVFLGYDGVVPEACWFPVTCETRNDGPSFTATVEIKETGFSSGESARTVVELPTGTLKRFVIPMFADARSYHSFDVRLWNERGKLLSEQLGLRPKRNVMAGAPVLGSLARSPGWSPEIAQILSTQIQQGELQPGVARLMPAVFPDNPLVLDGLDCLYLNSERAADLNPAQARALTAWLRMGGHLVIAVEQIGDVTGIGWLRAIFPCDLREVRSVQVKAELDEWLRADDWVEKPTNANKQSQQFNPGSKKSGPTARLDQLLADDVFEPAAVQVAAGDLKGAEVKVQAEGVPLIVSAVNGRGLVTAMLFSPEREPVRSWKRLPLFWAKLAGVPREWYESADFNRYGGYASDAIIGALIDSRQVHKLPLAWLVLLLIAYLVVIGPLDYFWLKRLKKPMLTWITFPSYVLAFSGLIYLIGYKLRSGEPECNELHIVDVQPDGDRAQIRGRSFASVYSPANARYQTASEQKPATFRGEFGGMYGRGQGVDRVVVLQLGDTYKAEVSVPVWTSQLFASDWLQRGESPVLLKLMSRGEGWSLEVENRTSTRLRDARLAVGGRIVVLGEIPAEGKATFEISGNEGPRLRDFVTQRVSSVQTAVQSRGQAFARMQQYRLDDYTNTLVAVSFLSQAKAQPGAYMGGYVSPAGLDLTSAVQRGNAVFTAWADDYSPCRQMFDYKPRRSHRSTFWRCIAPLPSKAR